MKKIKMLAILLAVAMLLSGCCLFHEWVEADCEDPKHCTKCGKTDGEALGHDWEDATCEEPETCSRCEETQGEALGHDWAAATCEAPETCTRCEDTQGEALGHTYGAWEIAGDQMVQTCTVCEHSVSEPVDYERIGRSYVLGKWECVAMATGTNWSPAAYGDFIWVEFFEDESAEFFLFDSMMGTSTFKEYDPEDNSYGFLIETNDGSYMFYYYPEDETLFIFGNGMSFAFEKVEAEAEAE